MQEKSQSSDFASSIKVVQIIKCTCTAFIDNFRNISTNSSIKVSVRRGSFFYVKHKKKIQCTSLGIPKGMKNAISISIAFALTF